MEVIKSNFSDVLPEVVNDINEATFVSIDMELTGLRDSNLLNRVSPLDPPAVYYEKLRNGSLKFLCLQFGLVAFHQDPETCQYSCKAYNFYTFPRAVAPYAPDKRFSCQASSLDFLSNHNFDFNKVFRDGITYMNIKKRAEFEKTMNERREREANRSTQSSVPVEISPQNRPTVDAAIEKLESVLRDDNIQEARVEGCNGFIRKLVYQTIREKYSSDKLSVETKDGVLVSTRGKTKEEREKDLKNNELNDKQLLQEAIGFSFVIEALSKSGRLVVGHNMFLDLCHTVHQFLCDLPENYSSFREVITSLLPRLADTKYISSMPQMQDLIKSTVLKHLYERMSEDPFTRPNIANAEKYRFEEDCEKYHDAAFDAYVTGVSFISLINYLASPNGSKKNIPLMKSNKYCSPVLDKVINRIFMMHLADVYMNLAKSDPVPDRKHVFSVRFPEEWTDQNINNLFSPFGGVQICWVSPSSAWVSLLKKEETSRAIAAFCKRKLPHGVSVRTYDWVVQAHEHTSSKRQGSSPEALSKRLKSDCLSQEDSQQKSRNGSTQSTQSFKDQFLSQLEDGCNSDFGSIGELDWTSPL